MRDSLTRIAGAIKTLEEVIEELRREAAQE